MAKHRMPSNRKRTPREGRRRPFLLAGLTVAALVCTSLAVTIESAQAASTVTQIVFDSFARTTSAGFGSADQGGAYVTSAGSETTLSVGSGSRQDQQRRAGSTSTATLPQVSASDVDVQSAISLTSLAGINSGLYNGVIARAQPDGSSYLGRVAVNSQGAMNVALARLDRTSASVLGVAPISGTYVPGALLVVEISALGTSPVNLAVRAWITGPKTRLATPLRGQLRATDHQTWGCRTVGVRLLILDSADVDPGAPTGCLDAIDNAPRRRPPRAPRRS